MASMARVYSFVRKVSLVSALSFASGCAALPPPAQEPIAEFGPTVDSPHVIRVCVKQPGVSDNRRFWANHADGSLILDEWELGLFQRNGQSIYYFDPDADLQSVRMLPIPYNKLECPAKAPSVLSSNGKVSRTTTTAQSAQKPAVPTTTTQSPQKPAVPTTTVDVAALPPCTNTPEPGQTRSRGTSTYTCRRTRTLQAPTQQATSVIKPPPALPRGASGSTSTSTTSTPALVDWNVAAPNLPAVDAQRLLECVGSLCHARHPNFANKGAKPTNGALSTTGGGGGGGAPKAPKPSTRKPPQGPKPAAKPEQPGTGGKPKASEAPKVKEPHRNRVDERPATRYEKVDKDGNLLKHGVTHHEDPTKRYTKDQLGKGRAVPKERGPRNEMIKKERDLVETNPGPENREPWAGKRKLPQSGGKNE